MPWDFHPTFAFMLSLSSDEKRSTLSKLENNAVVSLTV